MTTRRAWWHCPAQAHAAGHCRRRAHNRRREHQNRLGIALRACPAASMTTRRAWRHCPAQVPAAGHCRRRAHNRRREHQNRLGIALRARPAASMTTRCAWWHCPAQVPATGRYQLSARLRRRIHRPRLGLARPSCRFYANTPHTEALPRSSPPQQDDTSRARAFAAVDIDADSALCALTAASITTRCAWWHCPAQVPTTGRCRQSARLRRRRHRPRLGLARPSCRFYANTPHTEALPRSSPRSRTIPAERAPSPPYT